MGRPDYVPPKSAAKRGTWREQAAPLAPGEKSLPRARVLAVAKAERAWAKARTETNRRFRYGDPETVAPPLVKPTSAGAYGACPDDDENVPWHLRTKGRK